MREMRKTEGIDERGFEHVKRKSCSPYTILLCSFRMKKKVALDSNVNEIFLMKGRQDSERRGPSQNKQGLFQGRKEE